MSRFAALARYYWRHRYQGTLNRLGPSLGALQYRLYKRRLERIELPRDPLFVIGYWRTGTTLVHELLSLNDGYRAPTSYEAFFAPHFLLTEWLFKERLRSTMDTTRIQDAMATGVDLPQEDEFAIAVLGAPSPYAIWTNGTLSAEEVRAATWDTLTVDALPADQRELWTTRWTYFLRCLLLRRRGRLLLKSPTHTFRLSVLEQLFPEARYVYMVRDPRRVIPSNVRSMALRHPSMNTGSLPADILHLFARLHECVESARESIGPSRLVTVRYEDVIARPAQEIGRICRTLGLGDSSTLERRVEREMSARSAYRPNTYTLTPEFLHQIRAYCQPYAERHGYSLTLP